MTLNENDIIFRRPHKTVYMTDEHIIKVFDKTAYTKADVFNEALNEARVEETGLYLPKVVEVSETEAGWTLVREKIEGVTLESLMEQHPEKLEEYMAQFVDLQLSIQAKKCPSIKRLKNKLMNQINSLKNVIDATTRYELCTRLESMPKHTKLCHGDFNPSNVIVDKDGNMAIIDWAHAAQGNASADAAMTYLLFALDNQKKADLYMDLFCKKSDTARQYVNRWLPIVAAAQLTKKKPEQEELLMKWIDVVEYE